MSRSKPHDNGAANPAVRWFEWNGEHGTIRYYDKDLKQTVDCGSDFKFMLLDQLGSVRGWHEASQSAIYSNEVRDTRQDVLLVKAFKGGTLSEGIYKSIKDRVTSKSVGGQFVANCYIAFKLGETLAIGSLRFKGAALGAWMEFCKSNRPVLYTKALAIRGFTEGQKGRIVFRVPVLKVAELSEETNALAVALDVQLQAFLTSYLARNKRDQVEQSPAQAAHEPPVADAPDDEFDSGPPPLTDDDIPF